MALIPACAAPAQTQGQHEIQPAQRRPTPEQRFFDWSELQFPAAVHGARRERLARSLSMALAGASPGPSGVFLAPAADGFSSGQTLRQLDDFLYFTGLELPNSVLVIDEAGHTLLFAPERDARFENPARTNDFPGRPLGADPELARVSGIAEIRPLTDLEPALKEWVAAGRNLWVNAGRKPGIESLATDYVSSFTAERALLLHLQKAHPSAHIENAYPQIARLRMVKGPEEIALIRKACEITCEGIREAAGFVRPGVDERTLEAELEAAFKRRGSQRLAFASIIKSGPNSLWPWRILAAHYDRRNRAMQAGELVIFDVGCELDHYASDVGRTFPVSGRFTPEQARILRMETGIADALIAATRPGTTLLELQQLAQSLIPAEQRKYMQTGVFFGHHIGLYVGDPSLADAPLEPGMVFTVEPWYYDHDRGIAVFTEDDILVTQNGAENLTRALPRTPEALERLTGTGR